MFILNSIASGCSGIVDVPAQLTNIIRTLIKLIQIGVPILLVIFGMLDLGKAVVAQKEDEIKKSQQTFVKRLISAAVVFFVIAIVQLVVGIAAPKEEIRNDEGEITYKNSIWNCVEEFVKW